MKDEQQPSEQELYQYWVADFECRAYTNNNCSRPTCSHSLEDLEKVISSFSENDEFKYIKIKLYKRLQFSGVEPDLSIGSMKGDGAFYETKDEFDSVLNNLRERISLRTSTSNFKGIIALQSALADQPKVYDCDIPDLSHIPLASNASPLWVVYEGRITAPEKCGVSNFSLKASQIIDSETEKTEFYVIGKLRNDENDRRPLVVYPHHPLKGGSPLPHGAVLIADTNRNQPVTIFPSEDAAHSYYQKTLQAALNASLSRKKDPAPVPVGP